MPAPHALPGSPGLGAPGAGHPGPLPRVPGGLAVATIILAALFIVLRVVNAVFAWLASGELNAAGELGLTYNETPYMLYDAVAVFYLPLALAVYVVACLWLQQSRSFAVAVAPHARHERRPVWLWLGWWVPVVTYWFPYQVVRDVRRATLGAAMTGGMGLWWACWLVPGFIDRIVTQLAGGFLGTDVLTPAVAALPVLESLSAFATVVAGGLWIRYVRELTAAQRAWTASSQGAAPGM